MVKFIEAWRKSTGEKLSEPVPESWIADGVNPDLTDVEPTQPSPEQPAAESAPPVQTIPAQPDPTIPEA